MQNWSVVVMYSANMATMYFSSSKKIKYKEKKKTIIQTRLLMYGQVGSSTTTYIATRTYIQTSTAYTFTRICLRASYHWRACGRVWSVEYCTDRMPHANCAQSSTVGAVTLTLPNLLKEWHQFSHNKMCCNKYDSFNTEVWGGNGVYYMSNFFKIFI